MILNSNIVIVTCIFLSTFVYCEKVSSDHQHHLVTRTAVDPLALYDFFTKDENAINSGAVIFAQVNMRLVVGYGSK